MSASDARHRRKLSRTWLPRLLCAGFLFAFALSGCVTNDFKVVDALRVGMTPEEAEATIKSYGFTRTEAIDRPDGGWPTEAKTFIGAVGWRAGRQEAHTGKRVRRVEYYPVTHGLLGFGELFLFYGDDGKLMDFYRHQIN